MPPRVPTCPHVKLMNAPMGECCALKLMFPPNGGSDTARWDGRGDIVFSLGNRLIKSTRAGAAQTSLHACGARNLAHPRSAARVRVKALPPTTPACRSRRATDSHSAAYRRLTARRLPGAD